MGSNRGFNAILELDELLNPVDRGSGVVSVATRQANAQANLGLSGSGASGIDLVANSVTGGDSSLDMNGQAAAQGGSVTIKGGTSSTSANAGGAANVTGGTPGATGVGGAATIAAGIGGATSGAGGVGSIAGGAGTTNAAGGVGKVVGGAGAGSGNGGAAQVTGGTPGATGVGGAVTIAAGPGGATSGAGGAVAITSGTPISAAGSDITITASAGVGGTNAGGNVNLTAGAAAATGAPGEVLINGSTAGFVPIPMNYTASMVTQSIYTASRAVRVKSIIGRPRVAGSGGACTLAFFKAASGVAVGSGTALHTGSFNVVGTADTNQVLSLSATVSDVTLAAGDSIGYVLTGTPTSAVGNLTVTVVPV